MSGEDAQVQLSKKWVKFPQIMWSNQIDFCLILLVQSILVISVTAGLRAIIADTSLIYY